MIRIRFQRGDTLVASWHRQHTSIAPMKGDIVMLYGEKYKILDRVWADEDTLICLVDHE